MSTQQDRRAPNLNKHSIHFNIMKLLSVESCAFLRLYFSVFFDSERHPFHHHLSGSVGAGPMETH